MIIILDFFSHQSYLIAKRLRSYNVKVKILTANSSINEIKTLNPSGIIISGDLKYDKCNNLKINKCILQMNIPILAIGYGAEVINELLNGSNFNEKKERFEKVSIRLEDNNMKLLENNCKRVVQLLINKCSKIRKVPEGFTEFRDLNDNFIYAYNNEKNIFLLNFILEIKFCLDIAEIIIKKFISLLELTRKYTLIDFYNDKFNEVKEKIGDNKVILGISGGIDSTVTAFLLKQAIGSNLKCIYIDTGLVSSKLSEIIMNYYNKELNLNVIYINKEEQFLNNLKGIRVNKEKRKIIIDTIIGIFNEYIKKEKNIAYIAQGNNCVDYVGSTERLYSNLRFKPCYNEKKHIFDGLNLEIIEPLKELFKEEILQLAKILEIPNQISKIHTSSISTFGTRILGEVTKDRLEDLKKCNEILINTLIENNIYYDYNKAYVILAPINVLGRKEKIKYGDMAIIRIENGENSNYYPANIPMELLKYISSKFLKETSNITRISYDISVNQPNNLEF